MKHRNSQKQRWTRWSSLSPMRRWYWLVIASSCRRSGWQSLSLSEYWSKCHRRTDRKSFLSLHALLLIRSEIDYEKRRARFVTRITLIRDFCSLKLTFFRYSPRDVVSKLAARPALSVIKDKMNLPVITLSRVYRASPSMMAHYRYFFDTS